MLLTARPRDWITLEMIKNRTIDEALYYTKHWCSFKWDGFLPYINNSFTYVYSLNSLC